MNANDNQKQPEQSFITHHTQIDNTEIPIKIPPCSILHYGRARITRLHLLHDVPNGPPQPSRAHFSSNTF